MKNIFKKVLGSLLPLVLAFVFVAGTFEVGEMLGNPGVSSYAVSSGGDYKPSPAPAPSKKKKKVKKVKKENTITVSGNTVEIPVTKVKKKTQTIKRKTAIVVTSAKGKVTYKKKSGNKKITVNKKNGNITAKKGLKAGTYNIKVSATAAGNSSYKKKTVSTIVTVKVVKPANPMIVTANEVAVAASELEADAKTIPVSSAVTVQDAKGVVSYAKTSVAEGISVEGENIIVAKGLAPGAYTFELEVTAAGDAGFEPGTKYVQVTVTVN